jgi:hypothetical protein
MFFLFFFGMKMYQKAALEDIYSPLGRVINEKKQQLEEKSPKNER